jgi:hypothetical protein
MSNTAHLKFRKRITLTTFHNLLREALAATFGDALKFEDTHLDLDQGVNLRTERGTCLLQFWYESKGHISVDHRHGAVGYMVSDAMTTWLARRLNGRVFETGGSGYMDLTKEYTVYFMDVVRRTHAHMVEWRASNPKDNGEPMPTLEAWANMHRHLEGHHFAGKFARFWDRA